MLNVSDLLARANSLASGEIKCTTRLNVLHLIVSEKEVMNNKYNDLIMATRSSKPERNNRELRISIKLRGKNSTYGVKYYIACLDGLSNDVEVNENGLRSLIEKMTEVSNSNCRPFKTVILNGYLFKIMVHNKIDCGYGDEVFEYSTSFIADIITNMFSNGSIRSDLFDLADEFEAKSKEHKEKVHAMLEERRKNDHNRKSTPLTEEAAEVFRNKKKALDNITVNFDDLY